MSKKLKSVLIVAQPGPLRDALRALVTTMPQVEIMAETDSIKMLAELHTRFQPDLVVLDASVQDKDVWQTLAHTKNQCAHTRICVLVEGEDQQLKAAASSADLVLLKGFPAADLAKTLEELLNQINEES